MFRRIVLVIWLLLVLPMIGSGLFAGDVEALYVLGYVIAGALIAWLAAAKPLRRIWAVAAKIGALILSFEFLSFIVMSGRPFAVFLLSALLAGLALGMLTIAAWRRPA